MESHWKSTEDNKPKQPTEVMLVEVGADILFGKLTPYGGDYVWETSIWYDEGFEPIRANKKVSRFLELAPLPKKQKNQN